MPSFFSSIATKLVSLATLIALAFFATAVLVSGGFSQVEDLAVETVADEMTTMVEASRLSREISAIFIELDRISQSCHRDAYDRKSSETLKQQLSTIPGKVETGELHQALAGFGLVSLSVLNDCGRLNNQLILLRHGDRETAMFVNLLEKRVSEYVTKETQDGRQTAYLDQLLKLISELRETQLMIGKQIAEQVNYSVAGNSLGLEAINLAEDISLRLQTVVPVTGEIAEVINSYENQLVYYRAALIRYQSADRTLKTSVNEARKAKLKLLERLEQLDDASFDRVTSVQNDVRNIITNSRIQVLLISFIISGITLLIIIRINRRHIKIPLNDTLSLIRAVRSGEALKTPENLPDNEWGTIQSALLNMAEQLQRSHSELVASRERLEMALEGSNDGLWDWNLETDDVYYSARWKSMLGYKENELISSLATWKELVDPDQQDSVLKQVESYLSGESKTFITEFRMKHKDGHWVEILSRAQLAVDGKGQITIPKRLVGTHTDISERKQAEAKLQQSEREQRSLIAALPDVVIRFDEQGEILFASENISSASFLKAEQFLGRKIRELGFPDELCDVWENAISETFTSSSSAEAEFNMEGPLGTRTFNWKLTPDLDNQGRVRTVLAVARDITLLKEQQQRLTQVAHFDVLTGLPNRLLLADRLQQAISSAQRRQEQIAVLYIDLDGFKSINDRFGHDVGDRLLKVISERMKSCLRDGDTLARLGGDEFVAVLLDIPVISDCEPLLERLLKSASDSIEDNGLVLNVSASIGVTFYPQENEVDADRLMRQADQAMYQAKSSGKNRYHLFDTEEDQALRGVHSSLKRIKQGLRDNEFLLHYQPKVNMLSGEVVGVEALLRWQQPEHMLLLPTHYLSLIESHQLGIELGERVLDIALKQLNEWQAEGIYLPLSINISALQLQQKEFVSQLKQRLKSYPDVLPEMLELEILETSALNDIENVAKTLNQCKKLGVAISIDDFGTGYSSLSYLKSLSVDSLKIDQSFIRDMLVDPDDLAILEGVLGLARAFHLNVIAEGVETVAHGSMLLDLGCELAQGYAIAKPMPARDLSGWLSSWSAPEEWVSRPPCSVLSVQVLIAAVELQAWVNRIEQAIYSDQPFPELENNECRFGRWLYSPEARQLMGSEQHERIHLLHKQVHNCAVNLKQFKEEKQLELIPDQLEFLLKIKATLLNELQVVRAYEREQQLNS